MEIKGVPKSSSLSVGGKKSRVTAETGAHGVQMPPVLCLLCVAFISKIISWPSIAAPAPVIMSTFRPTEEKGRKGFLLFLKLSSWNGSHS